MPFLFQTKRRDARDKDDWHRNVDATVRDKRPTDKDFPWTRLQEHTKAYVDRRGRLTQEQIDDHLLGLIQTHTEIEMAFSACANALSPRSVRRLLTMDLWISHNSYFGLVPYLQAIVAANYVKPEAASKIETDWPLELIKHYDGSCSEVRLGEQLCTIISLLMSEMCADFLLRDHAIALARTVCQTFALQLKTLSDENRWVDVFVAVEWLSKLSTASIDLSWGGFGPLQLLGSCLPAWRAWAAWRPDMNRLHFLKETAVSQNDSLQGLLAIDGPDFTNNAQNSLKEGLIAQELAPQEPGLFPQIIGWRNIRIELAGRVANELRSILDRLSSSIDAASQGGPDYITLLAYLCTSRIISYDVVQILDGVDCLPRNLITPVLQIYTKSHDESTVHDAVNQVWPTLNGDRTRSLRESLTPHMVACIAIYVLKKQSELYERLESNKPWDGTEVDLIKFAKAFPRTSWLWPMIDPSLRDYILFINNGASLELMKNLGLLRIDIQNASPQNDLSLISHIDAYCKYLLFPYCQIDSDLVKLVQALMGFWQQNTDGDRRDLALQIARCPRTEKQLKCQRMSQIIGLHEEIVFTVLAILKGDEEKMVDLLFDFSRLLVTKATPELRNCWRMILYYEMHSQDERIVDQALKTLTAKRWLQWFPFIKFLFQDMMEWYSPTLLEAELHTWARRLRSYLPTLESLESNSALPCLLRGGNPSMNEKLEQIIIWIKETQEIHRRKVMEYVLADLDLSGSNAEKIEGELATISKTTSKCVEVCTTMLEACQEESTQFAEIYLSGSLQKPDLSVVDRKALIVFATHCGVHVEASDTGSAHIADLAVNYFAGRYEELIVDAQRLEKLRLSLYAVDPNSVSRLLAKLCIEPPSSSFDDMLATLPVAIADTVGKVGENEVELQFPITNLGMLQKHAIAAGEAESFLVRLKFSSKGIPIEFCVHLFGTDFGDIREHTPWDVFRGNFAPQRHFCYGQPSRGVYQLSRILWRRLRKDFVSLENIYSFIKTTIPTVSQSCIICGSGNTPLRRSTTCQKANCQATFLVADCEIILADIWSNPIAFDLLLTTIDAAAVSGKMDLLTTNPVHDATQIVNLLSQLPPVDALRKRLCFCINVYGDSFRLTKFLTEYSPTPDQLRKELIWACNSTRGFLTAAVNQFRIPSFGAHQFLLANASPELEMAFAAHFRYPQPSLNILFHGTSLDRLHAILCQGLRVLSNTALMRHAAARGNGIYMADEPATAWMYANDNPYASAGWGWNRSSFSNHRVLLGCELVGEKPGTDGIHVITDPTRLLVRYIFLLD